MQTWMALVASVGASLPGAAPTVAQTESPSLLLDTGEAFGDPMGALGFDLCTEQSAAIHFRTGRDVSVEGVTAWLMSHRWDGRVDRPIVASIRPDRDGRPSDAALARVELSALRGGWRPEHVTGRFEPVVLLGDRDYWLVLDCKASLGQSAIWCFAGSYARSSNTYGSQSNWQRGGKGPVGAASLIGADACYVDCAGPEGLDLRDYICFQARFLAGDAAACGCDVSTGETECDIFDFLCFQDRYIQGCD